MKRKPKLNLVLQLATICLCVCAIAIGVYSVKNASLSVTGTVNFTAHNCLVKVDVSMYGDAVVDGTPNPIGEPRASASARDLGTWDNSTSNAGTTLATVTGDTGSNQCYFSDMGTSGNVEDIVLEFKVTNNSDFPVTASIKDVTGTNMTFANANGMNFSGDAIIASLSEKDTTTSTATLQLKLNIKDTTKVPGDYIVSLYFERTKETSLTVKTASDFLYDANAIGGRKLVQKTIYDSDGNFNGFENIGSYTASDITAEDKKATRNYVEMGSYTSGETTTPLRWFIFAKSNTQTGAMESVTGSVANEDGTLPKGTYWFISEYAWDSIKFGKYPCESYSDSSIKDYLTSEEQTSGKFIKDYSIDIGTDSVYSKIYQRNINDKECNSNVSDYTQRALSVESQKLWLLSVDEIILLGGGFDSDYYVGKYQLTYYFKNSLAFNGKSTDTLVDWWTRSTVISGPSGSSYLASNDGDIFAYTNNIWDENSSAVRPAFQITI